MTYYYFGASLPALSLQGKLPFTVAEFLDDAHRLLSAKDAQLVSDVLNGEYVQTSNPVLAQVFDFERSLGNHVAVHRANKYNKEPSSVTRGDYVAHPALTQLVKDAANAVDPLEGEKTINKARWEFYADLMAAEYYTLAFILLYALQLKIVQQYHDIASSKGREKYEALKKVDFPEGMFANL